MSSSLQWGVVVIKVEKCNKRKLKISIIEQLYPGQDKIVRAVRVWCWKNQIEQALQHLYPLELQCDMSEKTQCTDELKSNDELDINPQETQ